MSIDDKNSEQKDDSLPTIRTFKSDAQKFVQEKKVSLINIYGKARQKGRADFKTEKRFKITSAIGTLIIALLIAAALGLAYKIFSKPKIAAPTETAIQKPFIFSDEIKPIYLTDENGKTLFSKITENLNGIHSYNSLSYLPIFKNGRNIAAADFFQILEIAPPPDLLKSLDRDFFIAVYTDNNRSNNFILAFKILSYERAFRAMIEWENFLPEDLALFITSSYGKNIAFEKKENGFYDKIINNIDARVLKTKGGEDLIVYAFFAKKFLIITNSEESLKTAIDRLKISLKE